MRSLLVVCGYTYNYLVIFLGSPNEVHISIIGNFLNLDVLNVVFSKKLKEKKGERL